MKDNNSLTVRKQGIFERIILRLRKWLYKDVKKENSINIDSVRDREKKDKFISDIKISIDTEINLLKLKLENGEIKAIQLTDGQIEQLQKIYDEEILQKKKKLERLKRKV